MEDCTKRKFASREDAQLALNAIADSPKYGPKPRYIYVCKQCGWFHLTKSADNYAKRQADKILFEQQNRIKVEAQYWLNRLFRKRKR
ncbi:hypothetical protein A6C57_01155 [Fibrella sp. ES10-3-2-2]|nr:hypothetical protein A6C57_01155 [Fibrella sp. ES10-3-2-2]